MRTRTAARQLALQALYQWDLRGDEFGHSLEGFLEDWAKEPDAVDYARQLTLGCRDHLTEIDEKIGEFSKHWTLGRMTAVDRNILRLGVFELLHSSEIPPLVAIDEAVDLAKHFSTRQAAGLVNGILDKIMNSASKDRFGGSKRMS